MCGISCLGEFRLIFIDSLPLSINSLFEISVCGISLSNILVCLREGFLLIFIDLLPLSTDSWFEISVCTWHILVKYACLFERRVSSNIY